MLYSISAVMGLFAVILAADTSLLRIICLVAIVAIVFSIWLFVFHKNPNLRRKNTPALKADESSKE